MDDLPTASPHADVALKDGEGTLRRREGRLTEHPRDNTEQVEDQGAVNRGDTRTMTNALDRTTKTGMRLRTTPDKFPLPQARLRPRRETAERKEVSGTAQDPDWEGGDYRRSFGHNPTSRNRRKTD